MERLREVVASHPKNNKREERQLPSRPLRLQQQLLTRHPWARQRQCISLCAMLLADHGPDAARRFSALKTPHLMSDSSDEPLQIPLPTGAHPEDDGSWDGRLT